MDKILLLVPDFNLRQLYHELLLSKNIEVIPLDNIYDAIIMVAFAKFKLLVLYLDDHNSLEGTVFLNIRKKHKVLLKTKIIILTEDEETYSKMLTEKDLILNPSQLSPPNLAQKIIYFLK